MCDAHYTMQTDYERKIHIFYVASKRQHGRENMPARASAFSPALYIYSLYIKHCSIKRDGRGKPAICSCWLVGQDYSSHSHPRDDLTLSHCPHCSFQSSVLTVSKLEEGRKNSGDRIACDEQHQKPLDLLCFGLSVCQGRKNFLSSFHIYAPIYLPILINLSLYILYNKKLICSHMPCGFIGKKKKTEEEKTGKEKKEEPCKIICCMSF